MKIILYSLNFYPEIVGIGKYTGELATWLVKRGHEVKVICAPCYFPEWAIQNPNKNKYSEEIINGVTIYRAPLWVPSRPRGISRIIHLLSFALSSIYPLYKQYKWRPDIILTVAPAIFCAPAALLFASICGKQCNSIIHIQDFELDAAFELGLLKGQAILDLAKKIEKKILRSFNYSSSISNEMLKKLHEKGVSPEKSFIFPNWVDLETIYPLTHDEIVENRCNREYTMKKDLIILMYSGSMNKKQDFELLIESINYLSELKEDIIWLIGGEGPSKNYVLEHTKNIKNVIVQPLQPEEKMNKWLNLADIHLVPQKAGTNELVLPSKILGMLASGKPIVATAPKMSELHTLINEAGLCVEPGDSKGFAKAIRNLIENPEERKIYGLKGRKIAEERFGKENVLKRFEDRLKNCKKR